MKQKPRLWNSLLFILSCCFLTTAVHAFEPSPPPTAKRALHKLLKKVSLEEADLSLFVLDLKYNSQDGVKICEIQPCCSSTFSCSSGKGKEIAENFVQLISRYWKTQDCYIADNISIKTMKQVLTEKGWQQQLPASSPATTAGQQKRHALSDYKGAVYACLYSKKGLSAKEMAQHPELFYLEKFSAGKILHKQQVCDLLDRHPQLKNLRPKAAIYAAKYDPALVDQILNEIPSPLLVLKPPASGRGKGIIMVKREELDATLKQLFSAEPLADEFANDREYLFWKSVARGTMLVEEFVPSDPQPSPRDPSLLMDPTMRVVAAICCDQGKLELHYLGWYWKYPNFGLEEEVSLTKRHKSDTKISSTIKVADDVWSDVRTSLKSWLLQFYLLLRK